MTGAVAAQPATPYQEFIWLAAMLSPEPAAYHLAGRIDLAGRWDRAALVPAVCALPASYPMLAADLAGADDGPMWTPLDVAVPVEEAERDDLLTRPFELGADCLARMQVVESGPERATIWLCVHHGAADGATKQRMLHDLARALVQPGRGAPADARDALDALRAEHLWQRAAAAAAHERPEYSEYLASVTAGAGSPAVPATAPVEPAGCAGAELRWTGEGRPRFDDLAGRLGAALAEVQERRAVNLLVPFSVRRPATEARACNINVLPVAVDRRGLGLAKAIRHVPQERVAGDLAARSVDTAAGLFYQRVREPLVIHGAAGQTARIRPFRPPPRLPCPILGYALDDGATLRLRLLRDPARVPGSTITAVVAAIRRQEPSVSTLSSFPV